MVTDNKNILKNIPWFEFMAVGNEKKYLNNAIESGWISHGSYIDLFEALLREIMKVQHVLIVNSGTAALQLALLSLGVGPGDEVLIPGYTFSAPANMVLAIGATPVFVDVDPNTWCICEKEILSHISKKTKAIIPVHIYGNCCNMQFIKEIANRYNLRVIEDCAEALFSKFNEQYVGTFGDIGCFSFQATKTITMGEGGAIVTNNTDLYEAALLIRNHGMRPEKRYWHECIGHNFRPTNLQASLGYAQLERHNEIIKKKMLIFSWYFRRLNKIKGIRFQTIQMNVSPVMWVPAIKIDTAFIPGGRDQVLNQLEALNIEVRRGFYSFDEMPIYNSSRLKKSYELSKSILCLPFALSLSEDQVDYICSKLIKMGSL